MSSSFVQSAVLLFFLSLSLNPVQIKALRCSDAPDLRYKAPNLWFPTRENPIKITFSLTCTLSRKCKICSAAVALLIEAGVPPPERRRTVGTKTIRVILRVSITENLPNLGLSLGGSLRAEPRRGSAGSHRASRKKCQLGGGGDLTD